MNTVQFSIIVPVYNGEAFLDRTFTMRQSCFLSSRSAMS